MSDLTMSNTLNSNANANVTNDADVVVTGTVDKAKRTEPTPRPGAVDDFVAALRERSVRPMKYDRSVLNAQDGEREVVRVGGPWKLLRGLVKRFETKEVSRTVCVCCGKVFTTRDASRLWLHLCGHEADTGEAELRELCRLAESEGGGRPPIASVRKFFKPCKSACGSWHAMDGKLSLVTILMNNVREQSKDLGRVQTKVAEPAEPARVYGVAAPFVATNNGGFHKSIINWLALHMIPPFAIDGAGIGSMLRIHEEFKRLAIPPARLERRTYGLVKGELSTELAAALAEADRYFRDEIRRVGANGCGATLAFDGMTKNGRKTNNAVLVHGERGEKLFVQGTNVDSAQQTLDWHVKDISKALKSVLDIAPDVVTFVCTDGDSATRQGAECVLNLKVNRWRLNGKVVEEKTFGAKCFEEFVYSQTFYQRCGTHGYNLLLPDVTKSDATFVTVCNRASELVLFVKNHTCAKREFENAGGRAGALKKAVETRYNSQIDCVRSLYNNWQALATMTSALGSAGSSVSTAIRAAAKTYNGWLMDEAMHAATTFFVNVLSPISDALRETDTNRAHMYKVPDLFADARAACVQAVSKFATRLRASRKDSVLHDEGTCDRFVRHYTDIIVGKFAAREKDCVSVWAIAAKALFAPDNYTGPRPVGSTKLERDDIAKRDVARRQAIGAVIDRIYADPATRADAFEEYLSFHAKRDMVESVGVFERSSASAVFQHKSLAEHRKYWAQSPYALLADIAVKLCHGVSGQGAAERANKDTANMYSLARNRQSDKVTDAFIRIRDMVLSVRQNSKRKTNRNEAYSSIDEKDDEEESDEEDSDVDVDDSSANNGDDAVHADLVPAPVALAELISTELVSEKTAFFFFRMNPTRSDIARAVDRATNAEPTSASRGTSAGGGRDDSTDMERARARFLAEILAENALDSAPAAADDVAEAACDARAVANDGERVSAEATSASRATPAGGGREHATDIRAPIHVESLKANALDSAPAADAVEVARDARACDAPEMANDGERVSVGVEDTANASGSPQVDTRAIAMSPVALFLEPAVSVAKAVKSRSGVRKDARRSDGKRKATKGTQRDPGPTKRPCLENRMECASCEYAKFGQCSKCRSKVS